MLTTINKYPFFDLLEIIADNDLPRKNYQPLRPVKTGNSVPGFSLKADYSRWQSFYNGAPTYGPATTKQFLNRPLVISFYSKHWRDGGLAQLKQLNALQFEIKANGGNLLIITAEGKDDQLEKLAWEHNLTLNFYYDENNELAEKFRVYSDNDPAWNSFSGIDVNVPLLATYVLDTTKQVIYDHIDRKLSGSLIADDILAAVYGSALGDSRRKSA
jgi:peroxiredoxin